jgi:hypothetical protein
VHALGYWSAASSPALLCLGEHRCRMPATQVRVRSFLVAMASHGAAVCREMLMDSGRLLSARRDIAALQEQLALLGYTTSVGPLEALEGLQGNEQVSPLVPELFARARAPDGAAVPDSPRVALQVVMRTGCFRCAFHHRSAWTLRPCMPVLRTLVMHQAIVVTT